MERQLSQGNPKFLPAQDDFNQLAMKYTQPFKNVDQNQEPRTRSLAPLPNHARRQPNQQQQSTAQDSIQVRYRDRNNFMQTTEGSITQTAKQLDDQRKKQKELKDA